MLALYVYAKGDWGWDMPQLFPFAVFAPIPVSLGLLALYTDEFQIKGHTFYRGKSSIAYWLCVAMILAVGIVMFLAGVAHAGPSKGDDYDVLLRSPSLAEQRAALTAILREPQSYIPRIQQSLRDYPGLVRTDAATANRAVYLAALVRDPSFAPILVGILGHSAVLDECIYACPVVFALTSQASFAGWVPPRAPAD